MVEMQTQHLVTIRKLRENAATGEVVACYGLTSEAIVAALDAVDLRLKRLAWTVEVAAGLIGHLSLKTTKAKVGEALAAREQQWIDILDRACQLAGFEPSFVDPASRAYGLALYAEKLTLDVDPLGGIIWDATVPAGIAWLEHKRGFLDALREAVVLWLARNPDKGFPAIFPNVGRAQLFTEMLAEFDLEKAQIDFRDARIAQPIQVVTGADCVAAAQVLVGVPNGVCVPVVILNDRLSDGTPAPDGAPK